MNKDLDKTNKLIDDLMGDGFIEDDKLERVKSEIYKLQLRRYVTNLSSMKYIEEGLAEELPVLTDKDRMSVHTRLSKAVEESSKALKQFFPSKIPEYSVDLEKFGIVENETASEALKKIVAFNLTNLLSLSSIVSDEIKKYKIGSLEHWKLLETSKATNDRILELARSLNRMKTGNKDDENTTKLLSVGDLLKECDIIKSKQNKIKLASMSVDATTGLKVTK